MTDYMATPTMSEILMEELMIIMHLSPYKRDQDIHVPISRIQEILHLGRQVTPDTSIRFAKYFGVSDRYFLDIRNHIDLRSLKVEMQDEIIVIKSVRVVSM